MWFGPRSRPMNVRLGLISKRTEQRCLTRCDDCWTDSSLTRRRQRKHSRRFQLGSNAMFLPAHCPASGVRNAEAQESAEEAGVGSEQTATWPKLVAVAPGIIAAFLDDQPRAPDLDFDWRRRPGRHSSFDSGANRFRNICREPTCVQPLDCWCNQWHLLLLRCFSDPQPFATNWSQVLAQSSVDDSCCCDSESQQELPNDSLAVSPRASTRRSHLTITASDLPPIQGGPNLPLHCPSQARVSS